MRSPLLVDSSRLRPVLDRKAWDSPCTYCKETQARWELREEDQWETLCSLCWLYDSGWGKARRSEIDALVSKVEKELETPFARLESGALSSAKDADRILGAVVALSRVLQLRMTLGRF